MGSYLASLYKLLINRSINIDKSSPNTQDQNGGAERSGGANMEKSRTMRIAARLPHNLWRLIVESACYLRNRTPLERNNWKSPYEMVFNKKPTLSHLKAYGCRAYAMTAMAQLKRNRLKKLDPRAQIGYLVGYASTNIYKIWIPHKNQVIHTRDVLFDEDTFYDTKSLPSELIESVNELVEEVEIPQVQQAMWESTEDEESEEDTILDEIIVNNSSDYEQGQDDITEDDQPAEDDRDQQQQESRNGTS